MIRSDIDQGAGRAEAGPAVRGAEPTGEERAAAAAVLQMIWGIHISRAVYVVAELGITDLLAGGPMTAAQLAQATRAHEPSLYRVLRLLASLGVLIEHDHPRRAAAGRRPGLDAVLRADGGRRRPAAVRAHHRDSQDGQARL